MLLSLEIEPQRAFAGLCSAFVRDTKRAQRKTLTCPNTKNVRISTMLLKIIPHMKLLIWNYFGDYSFSFQGFSNEFSLELQLLVFPAEYTHRKEFPPGMFNHFLQSQLQDLLFLTSKDNDSERIVHQMI